MFRFSFLKRILTSVNRTTVPKVKKKVKGNEELESVLEVVLMGAHKPSEIETLTGVDAEKVYDHKKTLKRYWLKIKKGKNYEK